MVAVGQTLVVLTRNIDLSVGSIVGFTAYFVGTQLAADHDMPPIARGADRDRARRRAWARSTACIVAYGRVPSIIVTLGTLAIYRGILVEYLRRQDRHHRQPAALAGRPAARSTLFTIGGLEIRVDGRRSPLVVVIVFQLGTSYLTFGRRLLRHRLEPGRRRADRPADAARSSSPPSSSAARSPASPASCSWRASATSPSSPASGLELQSVAAVVVGGVNIFGGSGTMVGALLGAVLIDTLEQSLFRLAGSASSGATRCSAC